MTLVSTVGRRGRAAVRHAVPGDGQGGRRQRTALTAGGVGRRARAPASQGCRRAARRSRATRRWSTRCCRRPRRCAQARRLGRVAARRACGAAADAAAEGMRPTIPLVARKGRASYLGERSAGHQDPGATSSWLLLETAAATLAGETLLGGRCGDGARRARLTPSRGRPRHRLPQRQARRGRRGAGRADGRAGRADRRRRRAGRARRRRSAPTPSACSTPSSEAWSEDGVLVLMDLGSAVLSAELALDLLRGGAARPRCCSPRRRSSRAPWPRRSPPALGEPLERVAAAGSRRPDGKGSRTWRRDGAPAERPAGAAPTAAGGSRPAPPTAGRTRDPGQPRRQTLSRHGAQPARPACPAGRAAGAHRGRLRRRRDRRRRRPTGRGPVSARSLNAVATLGVRRATSSW